MTINYYPNDPEVGTPGIQSITPQPNRPAGRATFQTIGAFPEGQYDIDSDNFLYWQCREAAFRALNLWEKIDTALTQWQNATPIL